MAMMQPNAGGGAANTGYTPPAVPGHVALPGFAQLGLKALSSAPGIPGFVGTAINTGLNANNLIASNVARPALGLGDMHPLSFLGGLLGLNNRADQGDNQTIAAPGEISVPNSITGSSPAVTQGGVYDASPFGFLARLAGAFGIGSGSFDPRGAYTMQEAANRNVNNPEVAANMLFHGLRAAMGSGYADQNRMGAYGLTPGAAALAGPAVVAGGGGGTGSNPLASAVAQSNNQGNASGGGNNSGSAGPGGSPNAGQGYGNAGVGASGQLGHV